MHCDYMHEPDKMFFLTGEIPSNLTDFCSHALVSRKVCFYEVKLIIHYSAIVEINTWCYRKLK